METEGNGPIMTATVIPPMVGPLMTEVSLLLMSTSGQIMKDVIPIKIGQQHRVDLMTAVNQLAPGRIPGQVDPIPLNPPEMMS